MLTHTFQFVSLSLRRTLRLMLTACCCVAFATLTQAQSSFHDFVVRGPSGPNWVDTDLYLPPNTVLQFSATGRVDVSAGWCSHGPEGTLNFARVDGYPVPRATQRYGLGVCLSPLPLPRRPPLSCLPEHTKWAYSDENRFFVARDGGHLWLTVNDDNPGDNSGYFKVHLEVTTHPVLEPLCRPCPFDEITIESVLNQPLPDPKSLQTLLVLDGEILAVNQSDGKTLVTVSQGSVLQKYGNLPTLKIVFQKDTARLAASLSKEGVIQGLVFQNEKMSLITGASRLGGRKEGKQ